MKKRKRNNNKWVIIALGLFACLIVVLALQPAPANTDGEWRKALNSSEPKIIYMGRPTCEWCNKFKPGLDNLAEQYNIEFVYVNTGSISDSELNKVFTALGINGNEFGTPYMAIVKNGKKIAEQAGYISEAPLFDFFQQNGFIGENEVYKPNSKTPQGQ